MKRRLLLLASAAIALLTGVPRVRPARAAEDFIMMASGVSYHDELVGHGPEPQPGQTVTVNYTGWIDEDGAKGPKFDSSLDRNTPFSFKLGAGKVIAGWEYGVATMHVGGTRTLIIPPELGYGDKGAGGAIPPNATLIFEVTLLSVSGAADKK